MIDIQLII